MARALIAINAQGRVTLPAAVRRKLHLGEGDRLEVAVDQDRITLRRAQVVPAEDAWAYAAESLRSIRRALADIKAGRVYRVSLEDLEAGRYPKRTRRSARTARR